MYYFKSATNKSLIDALRASGIIQSERVRNAMLMVDRGDYTNSQEPYNDSPQPIGHNATISAPHMHAYCLEILLGNLSPGAKILDIGSGSGYLTACMAQMVGPEGKVIGIEHIPELVELSKDNLRKQFPEWLEQGRVVFKVGDGRLGCPEEAPFDGIHVGAASAETPQNLLDQLKPGGRLVVPVGSHTFGQKLCVYKKDNENHVHVQKVLDVMYVPLTSREAQENRYRF